MGTKKCHIVQQAYLRFFASNSEKTKIWEFDKVSDPIEKSITNAAKINFYYPQWLENYINVFYEDDGINALRVLVKKGSFNILEAEQKKIICDWLYIQFVRTPTFEERYVELLNVFLNQIIDKVPQKYKEGLNSEKFDIRRIPNLFELMKNDLWSYAANKDNNFFYEMIRSRSWDLVPAPNTRNYYTSTNPLAVAYQSNKISILQSEFLIPNNEDYFAIKAVNLRPHLDLSYFLPLTPSLMLLIHPPKDTYCIDIARDIRQMNTMMTLQSSKIYSCNNDFADARNCELYLHKQPIPNLQFELKDSKGTISLPKTLDVLLSRLEKGEVPPNSLTDYGDYFTEKDKQNLERVVRNIKKIDMGALFSVLKANLKGKDRLIFETLVERTTEFAKKNYFSNFPIALPILGLTLEKTKGLKILKILLNNVDKILPDK